METTARDIVHLVTALNWQSHFRWVRVSAELFLLALEIEDELLATMLVVRVVAEDEHFSGVRRHHRVDRSACYHLNFK